MLKQNRRLNNEIPFADPAQFQFAKRLLNQNIKLKAENKMLHSRLRNIEMYLDGHSFKRRVGFNKRELKEFSMVDIEFPDGEGFD